MTHVLFHFKQALHHRSSRPSPNVVKLFCCDLDPVLRVASSHADPKDHSVDLLSSDSACIEHNRLEEKTGIPVARRSDRPPHKPVSMNSGTHSLAHMEQIKKSKNLTVTPAIAIRSEGFLHRAAPQQRRTTCRLSLYILFHFSFCSYFYFTTLFILSFFSFFQFFIFTVFFIFFVQFFHVFHFFFICFICFNFFFFYFSLLFIVYIFSFFSFFLKIFPFFLFFHFFISSFFHSSPLPPGGPPHPPHTLKHRFFLLRS